MHAPTEVSFAFVHAIIIRKCPEGVMKVVHCQAKVPERYAGRDLLSCFLLFLRGMLQRLAVEKHRHFSDFRRIQSHAFHAHLLELLHQIVRQRRLRHRFQRFSGEHASWLHGSNQRDVVRYIA